MNWQNDWNRSQVCLYFQERKGGKVNVTFLGGQSRHVSCHSVASRHNQYLLHIGTYFKKIISLTLTFYHIPQSSDEFCAGWTVKYHYEDQNSCIQVLPTFLVQLALWLFRLEVSQTSRTTHCMTNWDNRKLATGIELQQIVLVSSSYSGGALVPIGLHWPWAGGQFLHIASLNHNIKPWKCITLHPH